MQLSFMVNAGIVNDGDVRKPSLDDWHYREIYMFLMKYYDSVTTIEDIISDLIELKLESLINNGEISEFDELLEDIEDL